MLFPEAKTSTGESTSKEEKHKEPPAAEGEESRRAGEKPTENPSVDGKTGEDGDATEGEKSDKSGAEEQGKKKKKKDVAKKVE